MVVSIAHRPRLVAAEHIAGDLGHHHVSAAGMPGLGHTRPYYPRGHSHAGPLRLSSAGPRQRYFQSPLILASLAAELAPNSVGPVLDLRTGVHSERGQPGTTWTRRFGTPAILGCDAPRTRKLYSHSA